MFKSKSWYVFCNSANEDGTTPISSRTVQAGKPTDIRLVQRSVAKLIVASPPWSIPINIMFVGRSGTIYSTQQRDPEVNM